MTHVQVCRLCQSCQCLLSVSPAVKILRKNDKVSLRSNVKCHHKTILIGLSIFQCGGEKSIHGKPSYKLIPYVDHKTLKILLRGVNLCQRDAASMIVLESVEWFNLQHFFLFLDKAKALPIRIGS